MLRTKRGFTLLEAVVVLGILAALVGLTSLLQNQALRLQEGERIREMIYTYLTEARGYAASNTGNSDWGIKITSSTVVMFKGEAYASREAEYDEMSELGELVQVSGADEVVFQRPDGTTGVSSTINIIYENKSKFITINQYGAIQDQ